VTTRGDWSPSLQATREERLMQEDIRETIIDAMTLPASGLSSGNSCDRRDRAAVDDRGGRDLVDAPPPNCHMGTGGRVRLVVAWVAIYNLRLPLFHGANSAFRFLGGILRKRSLGSVLRALTSGENTHRVSARNWCVMEL